MLRGADSQWKRSDGGRRGDGAGRRLARGDRPDGVELVRDRGEVDVGGQRAQAPLVERDPAAEVGGGRAEEDHAGVEPLVAIDARHDLHDHDSQTRDARTRFASSMIRGSAARRARSQSPYAARSLSPPGPVQPQIGDRVDGARDPRVVERRRQRRRGRRKLIGERQQHVLADARERARRRRRQLRARRRPPSRGASRARRRDR